MEEDTSNFPEWVKEIIRKEEEFENITYPNMTWEERVKYWVSAFHKMRRNGGENSGDEYECFDAKIYREWKEFEPRIDEILSLLKYRLEYFDEAEMWRRIRS